MSQTKQERNKALVLEAFDTLFNKRDYGAAERYWSPTYIQHSAHIAPGREGLFNLIKSMPTTLKYEPGAIVADGDLVIVHGRFSGFGAPVNWIAADILRIEDGVLFEHWDVIQDEATQEQSKSDRPMFGDSFPKYRWVPESSSSGLQEKAKPLRNDTSTKEFDMNSILFQPFRLHDLTLPNRIVLAPMTRARAGAARLPNRLMAEYYAQRSSAGLLITEATTISEEANGWNESPGIYTDEMTAGWQHTTDAVHERGGMIFLQLWHTGRASHSSFHGGKLAVAPSAIKINEPEIHTPIGKRPHEIPRALETSEIPRVVADYRRAAERAKEAGFDGVELHAANGYLIDQFLQSKTNHRTDEYGGSTLNRYRFLKEVIEGVTSVWPAHRVGVRLAPNGQYNDMGSPDYREQFTFVADQLDGFGLAYLHVVDGLAFGFHKLGEPMTLAEFRKLFHGPVMGNCGYTKETAEQAIAAGDADLIAFGRPFISTPDLVERFRNGWPLAEPAPMSDWSSPTGAKGYTDFPVYALSSTPS